MFRTRIFTVSPVERPWGLRELASPAAVSAWRRVGSSFSVKATITDRSPSAAPSHIRAPWPNWAVTKPIAWAAIAKRRELDPRQRP